MTTLVIAPGASATKDQPALVAIDRAVSRLGVRVARIDLPRGTAERAMPAFEKAANACDGVVLLGGRSFGGRVASMVVAERRIERAAGLVLVSYPLHPPGKPAQLRTAHFPDISVPCLFVSGTRDSFGKPAELEAATAAIAGDVTHVWIDGGDHGLRGKDAVVAEAVAGWVERLFPVALS